MKHILQLKKTEKWSLGGHKVEAEMWILNCFLILKHVLEVLVLNETLQQKNKKTDHQNM